TRVFTARSRVMFTVLPAPNVALTVGWSYAVITAPAPPNSEIVPRLTSADDGIVNPAGRSGASPVALLFRRVRNVASRPVIEPAPTVNAPTCGWRVAVDSVVPAEKRPPPAPLPWAGAGACGIAVNARSPVPV